MSELVTKLDDLGLAAWIGVMVLAFVLFWPAGLAVLAYLIWSGRMACGHNGCRSDGSSRWERRMARFQDKMERWQGRGFYERGQGSGQGYGMRASGGFAPSGNRAFDDYREQTMRRLEEEFDEFKSFLDRLRVAKDKAEFEQFMADRRNRPAPDQGPTSPPTNNPGNNPWPPQG
jgi:hypothetical protein